jgi:hypothetical protein
MIKLLIVMIYNKIGIFLLQKTPFGAGFPCIIV